MGCNQSSPINPTPRQGSTKIGETKISSTFIVNDTKQVKHNPHFIQIINNDWENVRNKFGNTSGQPSNYQFQSRKDQNLFFKFKMKNRGKISLRISQLFNNVIQDKNYKYSPVIIQIGKIEGNSIKFISQGDHSCFYGQKHVNFDQNDQNAMAPIIEIQLRYSLSYLAVLSAYCEQPIEFVRLSAEEATPLWKNFLYDYVKKQNQYIQRTGISRSFKSMYGQMVCVVQITENSLVDNYQILWRWQKSKLKNLKIGLGGISQDTFELVVSKKQKFDVGTIDVIDHRQKYDCQNFLLKIIPIYPQHQKGIDPKVHSLYLKSGDMKNFHKLPQKIKQRYYLAKSKGKFQDSQFLYSGNILGGSEYQQRMNKQGPRIKWLRPHQFLRQGFELFQRIQPSAIRQGELGGCYFYSTIAQISKNPMKILQIFQFYDQQIGFYVVQFFNCGQIQYIVVDDYIACNKDSLFHEPLFVRSFGNQYWIEILEKAWAKHMGSYFALQQMDPRFVMDDVAGVPCFSTIISGNQQKAKRDIIEYSKRGCIVTINSPRVAKRGLCGYHAFSIMKVIEYKGDVLYKIRDPTNCTNYQGKYQRGSKHWRPQLMALCGEFVFQQTRMIYPTQSEALECFQFYSIGMNDVQCLTSSFQFTSKKNENIFVKFQLKNKSWLSLRIIQPFNRIIKDKNYKYSPLIFQIGKIKGNHIQYLSEGSDSTTWGQKCVYGDKNMISMFQAGEYFIRIKMQWLQQQKYNYAVLSAYCEQPIEFVRLSAEEATPLWKKLLYDYVIKKQKTWVFNDYLNSGSKAIKGQFILIVEAKQNIGDRKAKVIWNWDKTELKNLEPEIGKVDKNTVQIIVSKNQPYGIATLAVSDINKQYCCGSSKMKFEQN